MKKPVELEVGFPIGGLGHPPYGDRFRNDGSWVKKKNAPAAVKAAAEENITV